MTTYQSKRDELVKMASCDSHGYMCEDCPMPDDPKVVEKAIDQLVQTEVRKAEIRSLKFAKSKVKNLREIVMTHKDVEMSLFNGDENVGNYAVNIRNHLRNEIIRDLDSKLKQLNKEAQNE